MTKYDYSGKKLGTVAIKGGDINVKIPFDAGNCAMAFDGDILVCYFAREMYKSSDGVNHQASTIVSVNTNTMKQVSKYGNYASHSFDQRILYTQDNEMLFIDLGDAYPRGTKVLKSGNQASAVSNIPIHYSGETGANYINAQLGDVIELSSGYLVCGTSSKSLKSLDGPMQLFIVALDKETLNPVIKGESRTGTVAGNKVTDKNIIWLSDYTKDYVANPQMVAIDKDKAAIVWQRINSKGQIVGTYYCVVSAAGEVLLKKTDMGNVNLNGTEELKYKNGYIYWTTAISDANYSWDEKTKSYKDNGKTHIITRKMKIWELTPEITRIAGSNKYKTAYAVANDNYNKTGTMDSIIIVNKNSPADAISSGYLSKAKGGIPVILWDKTQERTILNYLNSHVKPGGTVYILGGKLAVPTEYGRKISSAGFNAVRLYGRTKYDTNLAVLQETYKKGEDILVITNSNKMDGVPANAVGKPLLLVDKNGINSKQDKWLKKTGAKKIYAIGTDANMRALNKKLSKYAKTERIGGNNSRDIAYSIANKFFPTAKSAVLLTSFGDGLVAPSLTIRNKAPILLATEKDYKQAKKYISDKIITRLFVVGGTNGLSNAKVNTIALQ